MQIVIAGTVIGIIQLSPIEKHQYNIPLPPTDHNKVEHNVSYPKSKITSLEETLRNIPHQYSHNITTGTLNNIHGVYVFDNEGYYRGFLNTTSTRLGGIIPGPNSEVVGVILHDGTIQNPNGTRSSYTSPIEFLLATVAPIKKPEYHQSNMTTK